MDTIKVNFDDFYEGHDKNHNHIMDILRERYNPVISDTPDYVFCGPYISPGKKYQEYWKYDCIRIFVTDEATVPDFNLYDYAIGFDELTFGDRYCRYPIYATREKEIKKAYESRKMSLEDLKKKKYFCNFLFSNGKADTYRKELFEKLNEYKKVHSGGRYLNNIGGPVKNKYDFQRQFKFSIACENSEYKGYTTEKIIDAYAAGTVPIYWGNPDIAKDFDDSSFINCYKYQSIDEVVREVIRIDNDDELYLKVMHGNVLDEKTLIEKKNNLREFLFNIFDQPYATAYRRNKSCYGENYSKVRQRMWKLYGASNREWINNLIDFKRIIAKNKELYVGKVPK